MAVRGVIPETTRVWVVVLIAFAMVGWIAASAWANPFETLPPDHWSYDAVKMLSRKGMIQRYVEHRLLLGYEMTYFDVAMWLGEAFERYIPGEDEGLTFSAFVEAFNAEHPESARWARRSGSSWPISSKWCRIIWRCWVTPCRSTAMGGAGPESVFKAWPGRWSSFACGEKAASSIKMSPPEATVKETASTLRKHTRFV